MSDQERWNQMWPEGWEACTRPSCCGPTSSKFVVHSIRVHQATPPIPPYDPQKYARHHLGEWITIERRQYADMKYPAGANRANLGTEIQQVGLGDNWMGFITNYLKRAELLRLDTPAGRQALAKMAVTIMHCLEQAIEVHGPLPRPGVPSGDIDMVPWWRGQAE